MYRRNKSVDPVVFLVHAEMLLKIDQELDHDRDGDWPHAEINVAGLVSVY